jgi:hypothetical protein
MISRENIIPPAFKVIGPGILRRVKKTAPIGASRTGTARTVTPLAGVDYICIVIYEVLMGAFEFKVFGRHDTQASYALEGKIGLV